MKRLKLQQARNLYILVEDLAGMGKFGCELHDEVAIDTFWMKLLDEVAGCFHSATCCKEVVV